MACSHAKGERLSPVIFPVKGGAYNMRLDGLLFFFSFVKMLQLKACVKSQEPIKILQKKNSMAFKGSKMLGLKNVFICRRRSAKARAVPNNLVPLAANIVSLPPRAFCLCLAVYPTNLCYTVTP